MKWSNLIWPVKKIWNSKSDSEPRKPKIWPHEKRPQRYNRTMSRWLGFWSLAYNLSLRDCTTPANAVVAAHCYRARQIYTWHCNSRKTKKNVSKFIHSPTRSTRSKLECFLPLSPHCQSLPTVIWSIGNCSQPVTWPSIRHILVL